MEIFGIPWAVLGQGGAVSLLITTMFMVLTGRLVPRSVVDDVRADRDARVAEARAETARYQAAHDSLVAVVDTQTGQINVLLEYVRQIDGFLRSLPGYRRIQ